GMAAAFARSRRCRCGGGLFRATARRRSRTVTDATEARTQIGPNAAERVFVWFQRVIAAYCLMFGVLYWIRLIGLYDGSLWRFDLMPIHWQVAVVTLAVFFPFAAIGLWMLASWGPVIWFI